MLVSALKTFTENIIDDVLDEDFFIDLVNMSITELTYDRAWQVLISFDSSQSSGASDTYLSMKSLPTDFSYPLDKINVGVDRVHKQVPFIDRYKYKNNSGFFYIDYANNQFAVIGSANTTQTIYFPYVKTTTAVTAVTEDLDTAAIYPFPSFAQKLLGLMIAGFYTGGVDYDDIYARMSPQQQKQAEMIRRRLVDWDTKLALASMDGSASEFISDYDSPNGNSNNAIYF